MRPEPAQRPETPTLQHAQVSYIRSIDYDNFRHHFSAELKDVYRTGAVTVLAYKGSPVGVLMPPAMWALGNAATMVPASLIDEPITSGEARPRLSELRQRLERQHHFTITVHSNEVVCAPYRWVQEAFPQFDLPNADPEGPAPHHCVLVMHRSPLTVKKLIDEFGGTENPEWEMDRRVDSKRSWIPTQRRTTLRGVVYVESGIVVRVRSLTVGGEWVDLEGFASLAPVSPPLTRTQIDAQIPGLELYPGDSRPARQGVSREYIDLHSESRLPR